MRSLVTKIGNVHSDLCRLTPALVFRVISILSMFTISYIAPYTQQVRTQSFASREEALRMIAFYASCGTRAQLV